MGRSINLSVSTWEKERLTELADHWGQTWGSQPSISQLIKAIAKGSLRLVANHDWSPERIQALEQARRVLVDQGQTAAAQAIARLLVERSEIGIPLRYELEQFIQQERPVWRQTLESFIRMRQPFRLSYLDAAGRVSQFHVGYAQIVRREKREYLECWCEETQGSQDLPELSHNWGFRLDRLEDVAVIPQSRSWRGGLDSLVATLCLQGQLALNYQSRPEDISSEWIGEERQIQRRFHQSFWMIREVLVYGRECRVIAPPELFARIQTEVQTLSVNYASIQTSPTQSKV